MLESLPDKSVCWAAFKKVGAVSNSLKIEIFCWLERKVIQPKVGTSTPFDDSNSRGAVGAGEATYKEYGSTSRLSNPLYLGKATFIHLNYQVLAFLGDRVVKKS